MLEEEFIAVSKPADLRPQDREMYEAVRATGAGLCARCKWMSGCSSCDEGKAWSFACRSTLWHILEEGKAGVPTEDYAAWAERQDESAEDVPVEDRSLFG